MIRFACLGMCLVLTSADASAQESRSDLFSQQPGRYQIVMNPQVRADTFLLDTATGKIWQMAKLTDMKGEPVVWQYMERLDNPLDVINLAGRLGWKAKEAASPASSAAAQPSKRLAAPQ